MKSRKLISLLVVGIMVLMSFTALAAGHMATVALWINGSEVEADSPPLIVNDRSMVPLRVITENMGGIVEWNAAARRAEVTTPAKVFGEKWIAEGMLMWPAADAAMLVNQNQATVLDVRPAAAFAENGFPYAENIPVPELADRMNELDPNMQYAVYCASGINAGYAVAILTMNNFNAYVIREGREAFLEEWDAIDPGMVEEAEEEAAASINWITATPDLGENALTIAGAVTGDADMVSIGVGALRWVDERDYEDDAIGHQGFEIPVDEDGSFSVTLVEGGSWPGGENWHGLRSGTHQVRAAILDDDGVIISFMDSDEFTVE